MRDEFPSQVKETLAKRVGLRCSNPECRQITSGPQVDPAKAINIGVAAHITAASADGSRHDLNLTADQRRSAENGIWLCQTCAKLIDNDEQHYTVEVLQRWKSISEAAALRALERRADPAHNHNVFLRLEGLMPALLDEMRRDVTAHPLLREFVPLKKGWIYNPDNPVLIYYYEDHPELDSKIQILQNHGLIRVGKYTNVKHYIMTEDLVRYFGV